MPDKGAKVLKFHGEVKVALEQATLRENTSKELIENNLPLDSTEFRNKELYDHVRSSAYVSKPHNEDALETSPKNIPSSLRNSGIQMEHDESSPSEISEIVVDTIHFASNKQNEASTSQNINKISGPTRTDTVMRHYTKEIIDQVDITSARHRFMPNEPMHSKKPVGVSKKSNFKWDEALLSSTTAQAQRITVQDSLNLLSEHNKVQVGYIFTLFYLFQQM